MLSAIATLTSRLEQALVNAFGSELEGADPLLVPASNPKFGDYQANCALPLAKRLKDKPRAIAEKIVSNLEVADICEPPEIAGPGFINLRLKTAYLEAQLQIIRKDERLGVEIVKHPQKVVVDFSSPNIAKEMHVGHLRSTIIGDSIARVLEFLGHDVLRLNHVGDWGTQFGMLITHLRDACPEALTGSDTVDIGDLVVFYKQAKKRFDDEDDFKERSRQAVVDLQSGDQDARQAWQVLCNQSRKEFQKIYDLLDIDIIERGESFYNPLLPAVTEDLRDQELLVEDQGAQVVFLDGFTNKAGDPQPVIIQKSDGGFNYATTDLAAIRYRIQKDNAERILIVADAGQANHFNQVLQVAEKAGWVPNTVEMAHIPFGLVQGEDGKRLKTRSGKTVRLKDLLDEGINRARTDLEKRIQDEDRDETEDFIQSVAQTVGIGAVKYADLSQNRTSNYVFSYDKMLALQGNTAPYMLYAYVRVQGISRKGNIDFQTLDDDAPIQLEDDSELTLAKHVLQLDEVIAAVAEDLYPNRLCQYLFELSQKFNQFYDRCSVLQAEEPQRTSRLMLCDLTARTLKLGLSLLGIQVLERM
ncbi:arginine--tRNA ligase [Oscillatoria sp. CS-180]|uniref:arginine--tRNA ligase n=1 Tax=Oscillatoria sp. CS-180 TaxID=3021720 RepID=UPI00232F7B0B|nr:arginine--tRNA ligase [Oscillatoria sp. CS-180]MDB9528125.1 arginine--tRNA ligase [Oscillatoria sp. CS-180]